MDREKVTLKKLGITTHNMMKHRRILLNIGKHKFERITIFLLVPAILGFVFLLPPDIKDGLKANLSQLNFVSFYTATFTHESIDHLLANIWMYYVFTFLAYSLSAISERRRWFIKNFLLFFTVFPVITYTVLIYFNVVFLRSKLPPSCGFSGIVSAILGLLPISFLAFLKKSNPEIATNTFVALLVSASALFIPYIHGNYYFLSGVVLLVMILGWVSRKDIRKVCQFLIKLPSQDLLSWILAVLSLSLYFFGLSVAFPIVIAHDGVIVDVFTHYVSWVLGILVPYLLLRFDQY